MTEQKLERQTEGAPQGTPKYLWRSGELVEWDKATVHISDLAWSAISAVFEGIRAYWNPDQEQLYVFHLDAHIKRLFQSMKIMRMTSPVSASTMRSWRREPRLNSSSRATGRMRGRRLTHF